MKKIFAVIFSVLLAFSVFSNVIASAEDASPLHFYSDGEEFTVDCEITDEPFTVTTDSEFDSYHCFEINASDAGVYKLTLTFSDEANCCWNYVSQSISDDGQVESVKEQADISSYGILCSYFSMEENEKAYVFADLYGIGSTDITLSYVGSVKEISLNAPVVKEGNVEIETDEEEGTATSWFTYDIKVTFSDGSSAVIGKIYEEETDLTDAESAVASDSVFGKDYTLEIKFRSISDIISSIELPDGFVPTCYLSYSGDSAENLPEYIIINFTDGTSAQYALDDGVLIPEAGEGEYLIDAYYEGGKLHIEVAGFKAEFDEKTEKESFSQVIPQFFSDLRADYKFGFDMLANALKEGSLAEMLGYTRYIFLVFGNEVSYLIGYMK